MDEARHFHLYIGTSRGCVADVTFSVNSDTTEVDMEVETLIQGHGAKITGLSASIGNTSSFLDIYVIIAHSLA